MASAVFLNPNKYLEWMLAIPINFTCVYEDEKAITNLSNKVDDEE